MTGKVLCYCGTESMFDVKNITLKSVSDSFFSLPYIFDVAPIAFQEMNKIVALTGAISVGIVGFCLASF